MKKEELVSGLLWNSSRYGHEVMFIEDLVWLLADST